MSGTDRRAGGPGARPQPRATTLLGAFALRIVAPIALIAIFLIGVGYVLFQRAFVDLLADRNLQFAVAAAARLESLLEARRDLLFALAANHDLSDPERSDEALRTAAGAQTAFDAGLGLYTVAARPVAVMPTVASTLGQESERVLQQAVAESRTVIGNADAATIPGTLIVTIATPIYDDQDQIGGVLLGSTYITNSEFIAPISQFVVGRSGFAYVVDANGTVLIHPDESARGANFRDRPYVLDVISGKRGGTVFSFPDGERIVAGYVPLRMTGWGLVFREPWDDAMAPAVRFIWLTAGTVGASLLVIMALVWQGMRTINGPLTALSRQAEALAHNRDIESVSHATIIEIERLTAAFNNMARRITAYRTGLRRFAQSLTRAQEEERLRIAHELHDDTIQSLLALSRQLELHQTSRDDQAAASLSEAQQTVLDVVVRLRRICANLRPPVLDDLGLVVGLRSLVNSTREGPGALPSARFTTSGKPIALHADTELALYRIAQEALSNVLRYAQATGVAVSLDFNQTGVRLTVRDDGIGFHVPGQLSDFAESGHFGLVGMQERAWSVSGHVKVTSSPGRGACIEVDVPDRPHPDKDAPPGPLATDPGLRKEESAGVFASTNATQA